MDYKKKYEDALNRAKKLQANAKGLILNKWLYSIFPELKESEDEQMINLINHELACLRATDEKGSDRYKELTNAIAWLEKQSKQKLADKVEPKFKAGDFIINEYGFIMQIDGVDGNLYYYHILDGNCLLKHDITKTEESCHLWTIQDAKDGDVLATDNNNICVFNGTVEDGKSPFAYCGLTGYHGFEVYDMKRPFTHNDVHPATKEQRDFLFQKMKEAGYEWDAEKKELKKIEHDVDDCSECNTWHREDEQNLNAVLSYIPDEALRRWLQDIIRTKYDKFTAWSKDDEGMCIFTIKILNDFHYKDNANWLKSLKERMKGE